MDDLKNLQTDNCEKLVLPEGLRNLMFDISREVLRAQPANLYKFIADYLSAMLIARDSLNIAAHLCEYICDASCHLDLDDDLRSIDLTEEEAKRAQEIINKHLQTDDISKDNLSVKLAIEAKIDKSKIPLIKKAAERALKQNILRKIPAFNIPANCSPEEAMRAAAHTLDLYWRPVAHSPEERNHTVTREMKVAHWERNVNVLTKSQKSSTDSSEDILKHIHYDGGIEDLYVSHNCKPYKNTSLTSLAGSYGLPKLKDHAVNDVSKEKHRAVFYENCENRNDCQPPLTGEVQNELSDEENNFDDEIITTMEKDVNADFDEVSHLMPEENKNYDQFEVIEDEASDADDESELSSIQENIEQ